MFFLFFLFVSFAVSKTLVIQHYKNFKILSMRPSYTYKNNAAVSGNDLKF